MGKRVVGEALEVASAIGNDEDHGDIAVEIRTLRDGTRDAVFWPAGWARLDSDGRELVSELQHAVADRARLLDQIDGLVSELRNCGASWTVIGWCTGMTQQAAHKRWAEPS
jgi:hypothetical protein